MPHSIQRRIVFRILAGVFVLLASLAFLSDLFIVDFLEKQYDDSLLTKANLLVTMTKSSNDAEHVSGIDFDFADEFMPEFGGESEAGGTDFVEPFTTHVPVEYFQLWLDSGEVFERSNSLKDADLPVNINQQDSHRFDDVILNDGRRGRLVQVTFYPQIPEDEDRTAENYAKLPRMHLIVAKEVESLEALKRFIYIGFILVVLIFILLSYFVVNFSVKSAMQPIQQLRDQLHRLEARKLSQRINVHSPPEELIEVVMQCNLLLERIEKSFVREQRFNSDVAHELRTPISELRSLADLAEKWPDDQEIVDDCCKGAKAVSIKMEMIVNRLLSLARYEDSSRTLVLEEISVRDCVEEVWPHLQSKAQAKAQKLDIDIDPNAIAFVSKTEWQLLVSNLLSNAVSYSSDGTAIKVSFSTLQDKGIFSVSNTTEQLSEQDLPFIFQRFWRHDKSRNSSENSGLGLSLVRALAQWHQFDVHATLGDGGIFQITVKNIQVQQQSE